MDIIDNYIKSASVADAEASKYNKLANTYSLYRLGVFALFIVAVCVAISIDEILIIAVSLGALALWFGWLIKKQNGFEASKNYFLDIKKVNENEAENMQNYGNMYNNGAGFIDDKHYYTSDLDIFGPNSLFQLVNRGATYPGIVKLAGWFNAPSAKEVIVARQVAVDEIAQKNSWKIDMQAYLLFSLKQQKEQIKNLVSYLNLPLEFNGQGWLNIYIKVAPWLLLAVIVASIFYVPARYIAPLLALFNYRTVSSRSAIVDKADLITGRIGTTLGHFVLAFKAIEDEEWRSAYLNDISAKIKRQGDEAISAKIKRLSQLIDKLNFRLNMFVKFILNVFFLWEIKQIIAIESWKETNRQSIETAFDVVAEFEALISLASLHINYPEWDMPQIATGDGFTLTANNLAHPLINSNKRIENDYQLNDAYRIDIITGSNMAGKSTFLRTVGINTVLALCGAPVCARQMEVSVMTIITYMRIKDSLNESTSTFKAELDRLQMLLKAVEGDRKVFFLIDEMLRGTNSVDKYLGSKAVIERLISKKGVGMVATHDLQIAELEIGHPDYIRNFYFDIQVKNGEMLFDYKIKHGECKTFNASLLLKQIGIDVAAG